MYRVFINYWIYYLAKKQLLITPCNISTLSWKVVSSKTSLLDSTTNPSLAKSFSLATLPNLILAVKVSMPSTSLPYLSGEGQYNFVRPPGYLLDIRHLRTSMLTDMQISATAKRHITIRKKKEKKKILYTLCFILVSEIWQFTQENEIEIWDFGHYAAFDYFTILLLSNTNRA